MRKRAVDLSLRELATMGADAASAAARRAHEAGIVISDTAEASHRHDAPPPQKLVESLVALEECQEALLANGDRDTAQLLSVALIELRVRLGRTGDAELRALCDAMLRETKASDLASRSTQKLHEVLASLQEIQAALVQGGDRDTAQLVSVSILELRIKLNRIEDSELKALCDAMLREAKDSGFETELARSLSMSRVITLSRTRK